MRKIILSLTAAVMLCGLCHAGAPAAGGASKDWPRFRGPDGDGMSKDTGINKDWKAKPPKELWKISLGDNGYAGPSVAAGKLFIIDHAGAEDIVRAVNITTGADVWKFNYPDAAKDNYGFARSTPTYDNGKLYTLSRTGMLHCLDAEKGTKLWAKNIKSEYKGVHGSWEYSMSPFVDGDKLIMCPGGPNASVVALDKNTGNEIWKGGGSDQAGYSTPLVATIGGKRQYVVFTGNGLIGVDPANGAVLWSFPWDVSYKVNAAAPIVIGDTVFIASGYGKGCALVQVQGGAAKALWTNKAIKAHFNSAILHEKFIYGTGDPGELVCLDPATGNIVWSQKGFEKGGIIGVDGVIIALDGKSGDAVMCKMTNTAYQELGRFTPLGGQSWTAPIIADGKLYVRNKQALVCLDLK
jgi:outer membrane protein assembly factor BamB